ncbi:MAG: hypothetical protein AABX29_09230 [Nanoarchaeota archaeon]
MMLINNRNNNLRNNNISNHNKFGFGKSISAGFSSLAGLASQATPKFPSNSLLNYQYKKSPNLFILHSSNKPGFMGFRCKKSNERRLKKENNEKYEKVI